MAFKNAGQGNIAKIRGNLWAPLRLGFDHHLDLGSHWGTTAIHSQSANKLKDWLDQLLSLLLIGLSDVT